MCIIIVDLPLKNLNVIYHTLINFIHISPNLTNIKTSLIVHPDSIHSPPFTA